MSRKWKIESSFFEKEVLDIDPKTGKPQTWPYEPQELKNYNAWLTKVQDPISKEFYKKRETIVDYDNDGNEIPETKKVVEREPYYEINRIVRLRTQDGKEWLYTAGEMYGYTALGTAESAHFDSPEIWKQTLFKRHMAFSQKENRYIEKCDGPNDFIMHYTKPFHLGEPNKEIDELMKNAAIHIELLLKEDGKTQSKECGDIPHMTALEMFKTQSFNYILNDEWQTAEQREEAIKKYEALEKNIISKRKAM
jgi:hypothetical protein